jgi:sterol desaturase/sphingolipid hydroxylase (fatty acid hydroxylase superfamily)
MHALAEQFLDQTPLVYWACIAAGGLLMETVFNGNRGRPFRGTLLNIGSGFLVCVSVFVLTPLATMVGYFWARRFGSGLITLNIFHEDTVLAQIGCLVLYILIRDCLFYFWHRCQHKVGFLWDIHAIHHSDTAFNVTTYLRQHWLNGPLQDLFVSIPMTLLFNLPPVTIFDIALVISVWLFFTHMNVRLQWGWLSWIVTGPQLHRLHHSCKSEHMDTNFAQYFPIWDILFGTYIHPKKGEFPPTGLVSGERMDTLATLSFSPFQKWHRRIAARLQRSAVSKANPSIAPQ